MAVIVPVVADKDPVEPVSVRPVLSAWTTLKVFAATAPAFPVRFACPETIETVTAVAVNETFAGLLAEFVIVDAVVDGVTVPEIVTVPSVADATLTLPEIVTVPKVAVAIFIFPVTGTGLLAAFVIVAAVPDADVVTVPVTVTVFTTVTARSEERRVGKECRL